jgi:eukaryotic-like serine/threonine-protein kinase
VPVSTYPAAGDYYKAVQFPSRSFTVPKLQAAEFVWDSLGPTLARGSSAVVFQALVEGRPQALRCYIRDDASSRDRYSALNAYLAWHDLNPYVSGAIWLDHAIRVNQVTWPVLTMEWIDGRTLNEYVDFLVAGSNAAALTTLAARWRELIALLQRSEFGHGDLQHGNVMVDQEGRIRLVDFDGVWIPQLAGNAPPTEFGHPNYQHPGPRIWDRWLDTFSALVIYLSLVALGKDPSLWLALNNSKNLLFAKNDFFPPFQTEAWKQLAALRDPEVDDLIQRLQRCCSFDWVSSESLEMTLDSTGAQPVSGGQRWWDTRAATSASPASAAGPGGPPAPGIGSSPGGAATEGVPGSASWGAPATPGVPPSGQGHAGAVVPPAAARTGAVQTGAVGAGPVPPAETVQVASGPLPAPPPLSAPLSTAGTGPMTQLRRTMAPAGETWWTGPQGAPPGYGSSPAPYSPPPGGPGLYGSAPPAGTPYGGYGTPQSPPAAYGQQPYSNTPQGPAPYGSAPYGQPPGRPAQPASRPPAPTTLLQNPILSGIVLGVGIVFLIAGAASHTVILVIIGLVAGALGIWRLVSQAGSNTRPPG